jgi:hypothetical protein
MSATCTCFRHHIVWHWKFPEECKKFRRVPATEMPLAGPSREWYRCQLEPVSVRLPPDVVGQKRFGKDGVVTFSSVQRAVTIQIPRDASGLCDDVAAMARKSFAHYDGASDFQLLRESCGKDGRDFRWSMTPAEIRELML